ncbi:MAG: hypothetical protein JJV99_01195 [Colwellia sp.]|nr:hypothetical protein [Colwellia sp.]
MDLAKCIYLIIFICFFSSTSEAKKRCKPLLDKLHNIQAMQRSSYSFKRGLSLRAREDKARNQWWQCEKGQNHKKKTKKKSGKVSKNIHHKKSTKTKSLKIKAGTPFKTSNAIVIKSKYHGDKKRAWLKFYQQPSRCQRPKNLSVFAYCSENKQKQRMNFDKGYKGKRLVGE